ncbi:MAG: hypothetical protein LBD60_02840 [Puniceicoccales bacterium]|jgi:hypothetical protein|nr:hypothetical protein [Puniceicoccales bacterium]
MKILNYINCGLVCLVSTSVLYGSTYDYDRRRRCKELVEMYFKEPLDSNSLRYREFLIKTNFCDKNGTFNENVSRVDLNNAYVSFFRWLKKGHLSSDLLDCMMELEDPDIDAQDSNGLTAEYYINQLSPQDRDLWLDCLRRANLLHIGDSQAPSARHGSARREDSVEWENIQQVISVFKGSPGGKFLEEMNIAKEDGTCNMRAIREDFGRALVGFFRMNTSGKHLSSDILEYGVLPGRPNIDARDDEGHTAEDYINQLSPQDRDFWLDYLRSANLPHIGDS